MPLAIEKLTEHIGAEVRGLEIAAPIDAATFARWGVDFVKHDFCMCNASTALQRAPIMRDALNATGRAIHFNMCEWGVANPWEWGPALAQVRRNLFG